MQSVGADAVLERAVIYDRSRIESGADAVERGAAMLDGEEKAEVVVVEWWTS